MKRVTIFWKIDTHRVHALQFVERLPICVTLNGEQYVEVTDEQYDHLLEYQTKGLLELRHKKLEVRNGILQPVTT